MFRFLSRIGQSPFQRRFDLELKKRSQRKRRLVFEGLERREMMAGDGDLLRVSGKFGVVQNNDSNVVQTPTNTPVQTSTSTGGSTSSSGSGSSSAATQAIEQLVNTYNLDLALEAGLSHLSRILDRDNGYLPFFAVWAFDNPAHMDFDRHLVSNVAGRALYALLAGHDAMGTDIDPFVYRELKDAVLKSLTRPRDGNWNNTSAANQMITGLAADPRSYGTDKFDMTYLFNMGAGLRGALGLATIADDQNAIQPGYTFSSDELFRVAVHNFRKYYVYGGGEIGGTRVYDWEAFRSALGLQGGNTIKSSVGSEIDSNWNDIWTNYVDPFFVWSLVHYYEETGHQGTLELLKELRDHVFIKRFPLNPTISGYGKMFERTGEMNAWARVAFVLNDSNMMDRVRIRYEAIRGTIFSSTGWVPEFANANSDVGEINNTAELIETALTFAEWGWTEYYEDVERFTRAMLLPAQLLDTSMVQTRSNPRRDGERNMDDRLYGAFGFPAPYGFIATKNASSTGAFHADITAGAVATLAEIKKAVYKFEGGVHKLNLLFDVNNDSIIVASPYPNGDTLTITTKVAGDVRVRVPSWADRNALTQSLDSQGLQYQLLSDAVVILHPQVGHSFHIAMPLVEYQRTDVVNGRQIKILWHGDSVVAMSPMGTSMPFFADINKVNAPPVNKAPTVNAGPNRTITVDQAAQLSGTVSDDGRSGPITITWTKVSGAGYVTFADPNSAKTTATFSKPNTFVLRLTVSDGEFTVTDTVTVVVTAAQTPVNQAPTVNAGPDRTIVVSNAAQLAGVVTDDGRTPGPLSISWSKVSGAGTVTFANPNSANTTATFSQANTFVLRLTVSDGQFTATDDVTVIVQPANTPPVVDAGPNRTIVITSAAQLAGVVTDDGRTPGPLSISWSKVSGAGTVTFANPNSANTTATFSQANTFVLRLTVSDGQFTATDDVTVIVQPANTPPVVDAGPNRTIVITSAAQLAGVVTDDGRTPGPLSISWSKVSGAGTVTFANPNSANTTATFSQANTFVLRLTVSDGQFTATDDVTVIVQPAPVPQANEPPVVDAGPNRTIVVTNAAQLAGVVTDDGRTTGPLSIGWSKVSGAGTVTFANPNAANTTATFSKPNTFVLRLTVSDGQFTVTDDVTVIVQSEPVSNLNPVVYAGADQRITLGQSASLRPTVSDDGLPLGGTLTYKWTLTLGPAAVNYNNDTAANTSVQFSREGTYTLRLTVSDGERQTFDEITIVVDPLPTSGGDSDNSPRDRKNLRR